MANPCDEFGDGRWRHFQMTPTGGAAQPLGELIISSNTNGKIKGHRVDVSDKEEFAGVCRQVVIDPTTDPPTTKEMMLFHMLLGRALYYFAGVISHDSAGNPVVNGYYYRALQIESIGFSVASDPGDTGGWGGSQGT